MNTSARQRFGQLTDNTLRQAMDLDCSISLGPGELQRYLELNSTAALVAGVAQPASPTLANLPLRQQQHKLRQQQQQQQQPNNASVLFGSLESLNNVSSVGGAGGPTSAAQHRQRTDALFAHFLDVVQSRPSDAEVFDTVRDLIQVCTDTLSELSSTAPTGILPEAGRPLATHAARDRVDCEWLTKERDTWRLLYALYNDRLCVQPQQANDAAGADMDTDEAPLMRSERAIVERLYAQNANLREYQLIVDWLEQSAAEQAALGVGAGAQIGCFTDRSVGWENTLLQLKNSATDQTVFGASDVVSAMDPDGPFRESRRLHDLDAEDQRRLSVQILREIRMGRIGEAQSLCEHCGQPWQAAVLEGWRLYHDANFDSNDPLKKVAIDGNPRRDLWKHLAWRTADHAKLDTTTRAIAGILCGHLNASIAPLSQSWPDLLWAYLKVQIDIRVESEIRSCSTRTHIEMPPAYWSGRMTLEQIFGELLAHSNATVSAASRHPMHVVQRFLILDSIPELLTAIDGWLIAASPGGGDAQQLRFLTHLVLFLRQVRRMPGEADVADRVIKAYVECLIRSGAEAALVAFYTAAVPVDLQTLLYSRYLRTVTETNARRQALEDGQRVGLDVCTITAYTVDVVRRGARSKHGRTLRADDDGADDDYDGDEDGHDDDDDGDDATNDCPAGQRAKQQVGTVSASESRRISALEWLTFLGEQKGDLLWHACALIRAFLADTRVECVRRAFEMVPIDTVGRLIDEYGGAENLVYRDECAVKEYLCYQAYLGALDSYTDWTRCFHARPQEPKAVPSTAAFTERIASEHREQAYRADLQRWRVALDEQTRITRELMFGVLRFPEGGFLVDPELVEDVLANGAGTSGPAVVCEQRSVQLDSLRKLCIPEMVMLLHRVLHEAGDYRGCVRLADELADEQRKLYAVYARHRLGEIIAKIGESSLALMNQKLDPWGYSDGV